MKHFVSLLLVLLVSTLSSQSTIDGKIIDASSSDNLAYVNIGIVGKNIGTVTNLEGKFSLPYNPDSLDFPVRVSMIGYDSKEFTVGAFRKLMSANGTLTLSPASYEMDEVVISSKARKTKVLGNKTTSKAIVAGFTTNMLGNELGTKIKIKKSPTYLNRFNVSIAENGFDNLKFRLNFYSIKKGLPDKPINRDNIIVETNIKEGVLTVDLEPYNIVVQDDFYVTLEWIEDLGNVEQLRFSAGFLGKTTVVRSASQADWQKAGKVSIGINVEVEY